MATDDSTPVEDSEQEPALHPSDSPVYQELSEYEYTNSQGESDVHHPARAATAGRLFMTDTDNEPTLGPMALT